MYTVPRVNTLVHTSSSLGSSYYSSPSGKIISACTDIAWFDRMVLVTAKIAIRGGEGGKEGKGKCFGEPTLIVSAAGNR